MSPRLVLALVASAGLHAAMLLWFVPRASPRAGSAPSAVPAFELVRVDVLPRAARVDAPGALPVPDSAPLGSTVRAAPPAATASQSKPLVHASLDSASPPKPLVHAATPVHPGDPDETSGRGSPTGMSRKTETEPTAGVAPAATTDGASRGAAATATGDTADRVAGVTTGGASGGAAGITTGASSGGAGITTGGASGEAAGITTGGASGGAAADAAGGRSRDVVAAAAHGVDGARGAAGGAIGVAVGGAARNTGAGAQMDLTALHRRLSETAKSCYPAAAKRFRVQGTVPVYFCISPEGGLERVERRGSSGSGILDRAATDCVLPGAVPLPGPAGCYEVPVEFR